jgi:UDP-GlcNAc:undecaprenyl-phosphate GlcNAc-1-phosphate transferase
MVTAVIAFLLAFGISAIATPVSREICRKIGLVDKPDNFRKRHSHAIPLAGGYAVIAAAVVVGMMLPALDNDDITKSIGRIKPELFTMCVAGLIILIAGGIDDARDLRPRYKLLAQVLAATIAYQGGISISAISNPFDDGVIQLGIFAYPATLLWFLSCINAINLIDGLDGLAGGVSLFACLTMAFVSFTTGQLVGMYMSACLAGSILGFLFYNFHPASVFLGDAGSMTLGFLIGALSLIGSVKAGTAVALIVPAVALGLPAFDTALAIARRWAKRLPYSAGDHRHIHHALLARGLGHRSAVLVLYAVCGMLAAVALLLAAGNNSLAIIMLAGLGITAFVFVRVFAVIDFREIKDRIELDMRLRNESERGAIAVEKAATAIDQAASLDDIWEALHPAFEALQIDEASFQQHDTDKTLLWKGHDDHSDEPDDLWRVELAIRDEQARFGTLTLVRNGEAVVSDITILTQRLRLHLAKALGQLAEGNPKDAS